jgi:hypothetical protein
LQKGEEAVKISGQLNRYKKSREKGKERPSTQNARQHRRWPPKEHANHNAYLRRCQRLHTKWGKRDTTKDSQRNITVSEMLEATRDTFMVRANRQREWREDTHMRLAMQEAMREGQSAATGFHIAMEAVQYAGDRESGE